MLNTPRRIIVAEDDPALRTALVIALGSDGYEVTVVEDGQRLLAYLGNGVDVDVIVTDVQMPRLTGLQALALLRDRGLETPCIVITAFDSPQLRAEAARLGVAQVLNKPFDVDSLRAAVARVTEEVP
jgi:CheY-like chemotaxis protein